MEARTPQRYFLDYMLSHHRPLRIHHLGEVALHLDDSWPRYCLGNSIHMQAGKMASHGH